MMKQGKIRKIIYLILGTICLVLAYVGSIMPGIPGTPFILLTAFFYLRSSDKMYNWLKNQKLFGKLIREYEKDEVVPLRFRIFILIPFWMSIIVAELIFVKDLIHGIALAVSAVVISMIVVFVKRKGNENIEKNRNSTNRFPLN